MKAHQKILTKCMLLVVAAVLCGLPEVVEAQQQNGTSVDPSQGPLQPVPTQNQPSPENATPQNPQSSTEPLPAAPAPQQEQLQQPLGAATAEGVPTVGGAASRPAGMAIAPDKQSQRRSLLIKVGLLAAGAIAVGTVYGLSKGTSAKPK